MAHHSSGWNGTVEELISTNDSTVLNALTEHQMAVMHMRPDQLQIAAWSSCVDMLQRIFGDLIAERSDAKTWHIAFEYVLPRERGRRPDVILIADDKILVLEFKEAARPSVAYRDQVAAYGRDLAHYHAESHGRDIECFLVMTRRAAAVPHWSESVAIVGEEALTGMLRHLQTDRVNRINAKEWLDADYEPLPSLVEAARLLFENEPLPTIRRAQSAGIPFTLATLANIRDEAMKTGTRHLVLVTGVPGAGKTLVGLQFAYDSKGEERSSRKAVLLSGNGPLVQVLQHALKTTVFVQDVHGFLVQYGGDQTKVPSEHVLIYDEAQRAWDSARVREKRGHGYSEPEDFLLIGSKMEGWSMMIGLIGEGQEIHLGEEGGLGQWNDAIATAGGNWIVHCPSRVAPQFTNAPRVEPQDSLDLTESLRSHLALDVQRWVSHFLNGEFEDARVFAQKFSEQGFDTYFSRDLDACKAYVRGRYAGEIDKRYGLIASSGAKNLKAWGVDNEYFSSLRLKVGPWYNDPPDSPLSCCQLDKAVREFACQGLELDFPIVAWGDDLTWTGSQWDLARRGRSKARDPLKLRVNSYRVLLSRGRDGFVVYVPPEEKMDVVAEMLAAGGLVALREEMVRAA